MIQCGEIIRVFAIAMSCREAGFAPSAYVLDRAMKFFRECYGLQMEPAGVLQQDNAAIGAIQGHADAARVTSQVIDRFFVKHDGPRIFARPLDQLDLLERGANFHEQ
ncbi:MAG: hypothetical protein MI861_22720 [Pirellulales bacterium]|nr:hypothetical protein [Pirellulales bacterium]